MDAHGCGTKTNPKCHALPGKYLTAKPKPDESEPCPLLSIFETDVRSPRKSGAGSTAPATTVQVFLGQIHVLGVAIWGSPKLGAREVKSLTVHVWDLFCGIYFALAEARRLEKLLSKCCVLGVICSCRVPMSSPACVMAGKALIRA